MMDTEQTNTSGAKRDSILPILPLLGALASLVDGAAGIAKAVNDNKAAKRQLKELKRYNRAMEGHGFYLAPYRQGGKGISKRKKNIKKTVKMPKDVTTNIQL
ncbi:hypothetical protein P5V15_002700 [Pogonomyrmex californicus]